MGWEKEVEGIERRRALAREHGGAEAVERQHARGRFAVRERIDALIDPGSFREHASVAGAGEVDDAGNLKAFGPANVVTGVARVDGRQVVVCGDDFTINGAAYSAVGIRKGAYGDQLATSRRIPLVRLLEGGGAKITGALGARNRSGFDPASGPGNSQMLEALCSVPVVCAALGPVAGFPAARLVASHLSIMTRDTAQVLIGGPALVERATGEKLTKEELGGADVHLRSGVVDNVGVDEDDVWRQIRAFLGYLPSNIWEPAPMVRIDDPRDRCEAMLIDVIPRERRRAYRMRRIIEAVFDRDSFFEMSRLYGRSQITGLARLDGHTVGGLRERPAPPSGSCPGIPRHRRHSASNSPQS